jgi:hypothetical protein
MRTTTAVSRNVHHAKKRSSRNASKATRRSRRTSKQSNTRHKRRGARQSGGGSSGCAAGVDYAPYNYTSFNTYRGNRGDSVPVSGATVPQNGVQRLMNWFNGKSTLFTPTRFDSTSQTGVQYQSQNPAATTSIAPLSTLSGSKPNLDGSLLNYHPFSTSSDKAGDVVSRLIPAKRGGGRLGRKRHHNRKQHKRNSTTHRRSVRR